MIGITLDTGALIAIERRHATMASVFALATKHERKITVPTPVLIEWWRGTCSNGDADVWRLPASRLARRARGRGERGAVGLARTALVQP